MSEKFQDTDGLVKSRVSLSGPNGAVGQDATGNLKVSLWGAAGNAAIIGFMNDAESASNAGLFTYSRSAIFNTVSWDRTRGISGIQATPYSGMSSTAITTATTTAIKASAGMLGTISNAGNVITGVVTVYDSLSAAGKKLWAGTLAAGQVLPLGIPCGTGITVVTAAADTIAVSFA